MYAEKLTAKELAQALKVSTPAVRNWTRKGMPCTRLGTRLVRFDLAAALAWLESRKE